MKKLSLLLTLFFTLALHAATDPETAYSLVEQGKAVMIDVREEAEIKEGMIKKALWFPMSRIETDKDWLKDFRKLTEGKQVFLYCRTGRRSGIVKEKLKNKGIPSENLGGYLELKNILPTSLSIKEN